MISFDALLGVREWRLEPLVLATPGSTHWLRLLITSITPQPVPQEKQWYSPVQTFRDADRFLSSWNGQCMYCSPSSRTPPVKKAESARRWRSETRGIARPARLVVW